MGGFSDTAGCVVELEQHVLLTDEGPVQYVSPPESSRQCSPVFFVTFSETIMDHPYSCKGVRTCRSMRLVGRKHFGMGFHSSEEPVGKFLDLHDLLVAHLIINAAASHTMVQPLLCTINGAQGRNNGYDRTYY